MHSTITLLIFAGLMAGTIGMGTSLTAAQAQEVAPSTDPAKREWLRSFIRRHMERKYSEAAEYLQRGACGSYWPIVNNFTYPYGTEQGIQAEARAYGIFLSPKDREELLGYHRKLSQKLPRECPPRTAATGTGDATTRRLSGPRGTLYQPSVEVGIDLGANTVKLPARSFLGTEVNGSFQPHLGLVTPDDGGDGIGIRGFIKLDTTNVFNLPFGQKPPKTSFVRLGVDRLNFNVNQGFGGIDPGANTDLLIPGPLGGASGFSIGPNAAVTGGQYGLDYSQTGFYGDIGIESDYPDWAYPTHLTGYVRGGVYDIRVDERFSGVIAAFNSEFGYGTHVDATRYIYGVGIEGRSRIARFSTPGEQDYWDLALRYAGEFGGFRVNGNGTDSLSFTGFPTSTEHLDASDSGIYYKLGVGFEVAAGPMKSHLMFGYENMPAVPVIVRDGNNPSQLAFGDSDVWSVKFGVSVGLGGVPGNYRF